MGRKVPDRMIRADIACPEEASRGKEYGGTGSLKMHVRSPPPR